VTIGHPGEEDVGNWILLAEAGKKLSVPFVASGGSVVIDLKIAVCLRIYFLVCLVDPAGWSGQEAQCPLRSIWRYEKTKI
jgi:hypothetical protein